MTNTIEIKTDHLKQAVPEKPFINATLFALNVLAGQASFDVEGAEGIVIPGLPKSAPINSALLALQATLEEFQLDLYQRAAGAQRFLALINSNHSAPELAHLVARNGEGQVVSLSARLMAGAAVACLEGVNPMKPEFDVLLLAQAADASSGEIDEI